MNKAEGAKPLVLLYGIERLGYKVPENDVETKLCVLHYEPLLTTEKFQNYDGVILFQGTFEIVKKHKPPYRPSYITIKCYGDELQRRKKQYDLLMEKKGFSCFLLILPFIDHIEHKDTSDTDLAKWALSYRSFYRKNLATQTTSLRIVRNEFIDFLKDYGAAWTTFDCFNDTLQLRQICEYGGNPAGIILFNREYFIPTLEPKEHETEEYFRRLADALISSHKKLSEEIPDWANEYKFEEEKQLIEKKNRLQEKINQIDQRVLQFREYKKCICYDNELLRESIIKIMRDGFGFEIVDTDKFREDFRIVDGEGNPLVLLEVKGTNKGITREYINQADSHRERAGLDKKFPSVLVVNTNIKKSNSLEDKYQEVAKEQIEHAVKMNILVMRSIDLLKMLYFTEQGAMKAEEFLGILMHESGWLEASQSVTQIRKE